jgi:signal transduction histidine kinase
VRWGALAVAAALAAPSQWDTAFVVSFAALTAVAVAGTIRPACYRGLPGDVVAIGGEVVVAFIVVGATGWWLSPFLFCLAATMVTIGAGAGLRVAALVAAAVAVVVSLAYELGSPAPQLRDGVLGASEIVLIAIIAGYSRRVFGQAEERTTLALTRVDRLNEANGLLLELYRVAQTLPVSLELGETLASTTGRLRELFNPDSFAILLPDDTTKTWSVAIAERIRLAGPVSLDDLPAPLLTAATSFGAHVVTDLAPTDSLASGSRSGIYTALRARGQLVGLIAVERRTADALTAPEAHLLDALGEQAALAIDNARWFSRLRTIGAEEERTRIARDLHDRVGQSLAYLAFELDRLATHSEGLSVHAEIEALRTDVRQVVTDVRETLYDLRTDVTEERPLVSALAGFLDRVSGRSGLVVSFHPDVDGRLPLTVERELWRIAMEAVANVERHAHARSVDVTLVTTGGGTTLEVSDDGVGFNAGRRRSDSFGIVGMRERADALGASLELFARPAGGTTLRCQYHSNSQQGAA